MILSTHGLAHGSGGQVLPPDPDLAPRRPEENKFAVLEAAMLLYQLPGLTKRITPADMWILNRMATHLSQSQIDEGWTKVWPSVRTLAIATPYSERQVRLSLRRLEALGLIQPVMLGNMPAYDLKGLLDLASAAHEAHIDARIAAGLDNLIVGSIFRLRGRNCTTEPNSEPAKSVPTAEATPTHSSRRSAPPPAQRAKTDPNHQATTKTPRTNCSPTGAAASSEPDPHTPPAEIPRADLVAAHERCPALRRWLTTDDIQSLPTEQLSARACAAYTDEIRSSRRRIPTTWAQVVARQGHLRTIILAAASLDDPTVRQASSFFGYFGTERAPLAAEFASNVERIHAAQSCAEAPEALPLSADFATDAVELPPAVAGRPEAAEIPGGSIDWDRLVRDVGKLDEPGRAKAWLRRVSVRGIADGTLYLIAENTFTKDWIERNYRTFLIQASARQFRTIKDVVVDDQSRMT